MLSSVLSNWMLNCGPLAFIDSMAVGIESCLNSLVAEKIKTCAWGVVVCADVMLMVVDRLANTLAVNKEGKSMATGSLQR